ncbi:hypothetical protein [Micromonospora sp. NPDC005652]|uniref:hypothetical protein n=1 Tax=Micromonospora sp. NPDC005652 TaxID=3157046 RepID=UPI0033C1FE19
MSGAYDVIVLDAESNGLAGQAFAFGAITCDAAGELAAVTYRCPIVGPVDPWVAENVLPVIEDVEVNCEDYAELCAALRQTWAAWGGEVKRSRMLTHIAWPVEARLLLDAFPGRHVWKGPFPLNDVANTLTDRGFDSTSVDRYLDQQGLGKPVGNPHNPLYDVRATERAYYHLRTGRSRL